MKRKPQEASAGASQPGTMGDGNNEVTAYAAKEETGRAILAALQQRSEFPQSKSLQTSAMCSLTRSAPMLPESYAKSVNRLRTSSGCKSMIETHTDRS